jgi:hypothetical protein
MAYRLRNIWKIGNEKLMKTVVISTELDESLMANN